MNEPDWADSSLYANAQLSDLYLNGQLPSYPAADLLQPKLDTHQHPVPQLQPPPMQGWQGPPHNKNIPLVPQSAMPVNQHHQLVWHPVEPPLPPLHTPAGQARASVKFHTYQTPESQPRVRPVPVPFAYGFDGPRQTEVDGLGSRSGPAVLVWDIAADTSEGDTTLHETSSRISRKWLSGSQVEEGDEGGAERTVGKKAKKSTPKAKGKTKEKEKSKVKAMKDSAKPRTGKGSRSGPANRRQGGALDDEIQKLSSAIKWDAEPWLANAQLKKLREVIDGDSERGISTDVEPDEGEGDQSDGEAGSGSEVDVGEFDDSESKWGLDQQEKELAVEYLADPGRYANIRTKLGEYCITMGQVLFKGCITAEQIRNFWNNNAFKKYKEIRVQLLHMGGRDPNAARMDGNEGPPAQRPEKKSDVTFTRTKTFSVAVLLSFYQLKMYDLIDAVAWSNSAVERIQKYNSADPVSQTKRQRKGERGSGEPAFIVQAFQQFAECNKATQEVERERLELEKCREAWEEEECKERAEIRHCQEKREAQAAREVQ